MGLQGAGGVKNFSLGICDGAPSTVCFSFFCIGALCPSQQKFQLCWEVNTKQRIKFLAQEHNTVLLVSEAPTSEPTTPNQALVCTTELLPSFENSSDEAS